MAGADEKSTNAPQILIKKGNFYIPSKNTIVEADNAADAVEQVKSKKKKGNK